MKPVSSALPWLAAPVRMAIDSGMIGKNSRRFINIQLVGDVEIWTAPKIFCIRIASDPQAHRHFR
jgi:hypothetical protein